MSPHLLCVSSDTTSFRVYLKDCPPTTSHAAENTALAIPLVHFIVEQFADLVEKGGRQRAAAASDSE